MKRLVLCLAAGLYAIGTDSSPGDGGLPPLTEAKQWPAPLIDET